MTAETTTPEPTTPSDTPTEEVVEETPVPDQTDPEKPVQPADVDPAPSKVVALDTRRGSLTLRPNQVELDPEQYWALKAIGIDTVGDPAVVPHLRAFIHMCQIRDLDPFAREAYLIGRGRGENRSYTMQVGIDGYRKMAASTGRFLRVVETLWTGQDDDDRSYRPDDRGIMRRVWYDQWPASRGYPGAAKVIIEHLDADGRVTETEAVADWAMYAPFTTDWDWHPTQRGKKVYKTNPDGTLAQKLNDMWTKGYAHMLAKCAEALAHRKAFPKTMSGMYVTEEMHRLDQQEQERQRTERRGRLVDAHQASLTQTPTPGPVKVPTATEQPSREAEPDQGDQGDQEEVHDVEVVDDRPDDVLVGLLRAEMEWVADLIGHDVKVLTRRHQTMVKRGLEQFTRADYLAVREQLKPAVVSRLKSSNRDRDLAVYEAVGVSEVIDIGTLFGEAAAPAKPVDPNTLHDHVGSSRDEPCEVCGRFADELPHPRKD